MCKTSISLEQQDNWAVRWSRSGGSSLRRTRRSPKKSEQLVVKVTASATKRWERSMLFIAKRLRGWDTQGEDRPQVAGDQDGSLLEQSDEYDS